MAMVETGYRYAEMYFAVKNGNWDFALYNAQKLAVAITNACHAAENLSFMKVAKPTQKLSPIAD